MELFSLFATIGLKDAGFNQGVDDATKKGEGFGSSFSGVMAGIGKATLTGLAVAGTAISALVTGAVKNFAEYEQLVGGVKTLFKDSASTVMSYADNAYKTAGLSANKYMETVTSFSASLLQSLKGDTKAAAAAGDMAVTDMADNANKMGTSMDAIQFAYQGFAKQNYTMLDNLKLGYGGTKTEMERLLADATKISGVKYDISNLSDVYNAIHVIQTELGIANATAEEASSTIQGSAAAMGAAWSNMMTGLADPSQDFDQLLKNLIDSAGTFAENLIPRIEIALEGIAKLIEKLAPIIAEKFPALMEKILPSLLSAAIGLITAFVSAIPTILDALIGALPMIIDAAVQLFMGLVLALPVIIQALVDALPTVIEAVINALIEALPLLIDASIQLFMALVEAIPIIINLLIEKFPEIAAAVLAGFQQIYTSIMEYLPTLIEMVVTFFVELPQKIQDAIMATIDKLIEFYDSMIEWAVENIPLIIDKIITFFSELPQKIWDAIIGASAKIVAWGTELVAKGTKAAQDLLDVIVKKVGEIPQKMVDAGRNIIEGFWNGINNAKDWLMEKISGFFDGVVSSIKNFFGIKSPSKLMAGIGEFVSEGFIVGMESMSGAIDQTINDLFGSPIDAIVNVSQSGGLSGISLDSVNTDAITSASGNTYIFNNPLPQSPYEQMQAAEAMVQIAGWA